MEIVDYVLDGLEAALELERELGVRTVEIDRSVLTATPAGVSRLPSQASSPSPGGLEAKDMRRETAAGRETRDVRPTPLPGNQTINQSNNQTILPLVFLHDRPLSPQGVEMMAKIVTAMGRTADTAPIVVVPPAPKAKVVVILGGRAMKLYFPEMKAGPGQWVRTPEGQDVLVTYSPEYILRFGTVTPAVQKLKQEMWRSLKAVVQRLR